MADGEVEGAGLKDDVEPVGGSNAPSHPSNYQSGEVSDAVDASVVDHTRIREHQLVRDRLLADWGWLPTQVPALAVRLARERMLVLSSHHPLIGEAALAGILRQADFLGVKDIRLSASWPPTHPFRNEKVLALYNWSFDQPCPMVDQLRDRLTVGAVRDALETHNWYAIVITTPREVEATRIRALDVVVHLPVVDAILDAFGITQERDYLKQRVGALQRAGVLPTREDELYRILNTDHKEALHDRLERLAQPNQVGLEPPADCPADLFWALIWICTFLPDLPADDLPAVLGPLLADGTVPREGKVKKKDPPPISLLAFWKAQYASLMATLGLSFSRMNHVISPLRPVEQVACLTLSSEKVEQVRRHFDEVRLLDHMAFLERIEEASLLFHPQAGVHLAIERMVVEEARRRPGRFGERWLIRMLHFAVHRGLAAQVEAVQTLGQVVEGLDATVRRGYLQRIGRVMRAMYGADNLREVVAGLLTALLRDPTLRNELPGLFRQLRVHESFDVLDWCRRLIEAGTSQEAQAALQVAFETLQEARLVDGLNVLTSAWLLGTSLKASTSAARMLVRLIEVALDHAGTPGQWPPNGLLLRQAVTSMNSEWLSKTVIHPLFDPTVVDVAKTEATRHQEVTLHAHLLPKDFGRDLTPAQSRGLVDQMLRHFVNAPDSEGLAERTLPALLLLKWSRVLAPDTGETDSPGSQLITDLLQAVAQAGRPARARGLLRVWEALERCLADACNMLVTISPNTLAHRERRRGLIEQTRVYRRQLRALQRQLTEALRTPTHRSGDQA